MRCPFCNYEDTKVVDSRPASEGMSIRRRRECRECQSRFSTFEEMEILDSKVVKKDGAEEPYDKDKLERGLRKALEKRPVTGEQFRHLTSEIEQAIQKTAEDGTIQSSQIGNIVTRKLKKYDQVAYIRFASVYRDFKDVKEFEKELKKL